MAKVKSMTREEGERYNISNYPNFHISGSVKGMKNLYYGKNCLLVKCGDYIYNVSSNEEIYNNAH